MVIGAITPCALAAEWAIEPSVETRGSVTDNINLMPNVHDNVFGWTVAPNVVFARRTEATEVAGTARLGINRYPGNSDLDTDDATLSLTSQLRDERNTYGLSAAYIRDSTLQTELATTGIVQARKQRNLVSLSPSWNYSLTERASVFAQYRDDQVKYQAGAGLEDYTNRQATAGYQHLLSERSTATVSGSYNRYETDTGGTLTTSYGLSVGLTHSPVEPLTLGLGIGARRSDTTITNMATSKTSDDGLTFNASADYKWERTHANVAASRDINPSGTGQVVQTDQLAIGIGHQFSERLSGNANAAYLLSRYIAGPGSDTEYINLNSSLGWNLDESWRAGAGYSFAYQRVKGGPDSASANTIYLSISYNWPKISISR